MLAGCTLRITQQLISDIARLATIPHGDSDLALGRCSESTDNPVIPNDSGLPTGVNQSLADPYLAPYKHFDENLFKGLVTPVNPNALIKSGESESQC